MPSTRFGHAAGWFANVSWTITPHSSAVDSSMRVKVRRRVVAAGLRSCHSILAHHVSGGQVRSEDWRAVWWARRSPSSRACSSPRWRRRSSRASTGPGSRTVAAPVLWAFGGGAGLGIGRSGGFVDLPPGAGRDLRRRGGRVAVPGARGGRLQQLRPAGRGPARRLAAHRGAARACWWRSSWLASPPSWPGRSAVGATAGAGARHRADRPVESFAPRAPTCSIPLAFLLLRSSPCPPRASSAQRRHRRPRRPRQDHPRRRHAPPDRRVPRQPGGRRPGHGLDGPRAREGHHDPRQEHRGALRRREDQHRRHARPRRLRRRGRAGPHDGRRRAAARRRQRGPAAPDPLRAAQDARSAPAGDPRGQQGRPQRRPHRRGRPRGRGAVPRPRRRRAPDRLPDRLLQRP